MSLAAGPFYPHWFPPHYTVVAIEVFETIWTCTSFLTLYLLFFASTYLPYFLLELYCYLRSPYRDLTRYDAAVQVSECHIIFFHTCMKVISLLTSLKLVRHATGSPGSLTAITQ